MGDSTSKSEYIRGHCPDCGADRLSDVVGHGCRTFDLDERHGIWEQVDYRILQCRGCEAVYFQIDSVFSEDIDAEINTETGEWETVAVHKITHWPSPSKRRQPTWQSELFSIDRDLSAIVDDVYVALNNDLLVLSAIGIRTAFDRASELLGVDPAENFSQKLLALVKLGKIGLSEKETLDTLADAGSTAAHRGWKPKPQELDTMMNIIEGFLHRAFVLRSRGEKLEAERSREAKATKVLTD